MVRLRDRGTPAAHCTPLSPTKNGLRGVVGPVGLVAAEGWLIGQSRLFNYHLAPLGPPNWSFNQNAGATTHTPLLPCSPSVAGQPRHAVLRATFCAV